MRNSKPNTNNQAPINHQYPIFNNQTKIFLYYFSSGYSVIGYWVLIGDLCLVIGYSNSIGH